MSSQGRNTPLSFAQYEHATAAKIARVRVVPGILACHDLRVGDGVLSELCGAQQLGSRVELPLGPSASDSPLSTNRLQKAIEILLQSC